MNNINDNIITLYQPFKLAVAWECFDPCLKDFPSVSIKIKFHFCWGNPFDFINFRSIVSIEDNAGKIMGKQP